MWHSYVSLNKTSMHNEIFTKLKKLIEIFDFVLTQRASAPWQYNQISDFDTFYGDFGWSILYQSI